MDSNSTITLRQCEVFKAIADELHFGRAAKRLGVAQPAVTQQLKLLEIAFQDEQLFDRNRRRVILTEFGAKMLPEIRALLQQAKRVENVAALAIEGRFGRLELAYIGSAAYAGILAPILRRFRTNAQNVELILREMDMDLQIQEITAGRLDAGFVRLPLPNIPDALVTRTIYEEDILLAVPPDHWLAGAIVAEVKDLAGEAFIFTHLGSNVGFSACAHRLCAEAGFTPDITQRASQFTAIVSFVSAGLGIAFVPSSAARLTHTGARFLPIVDTSIKSRIGLAYLAGRPNATLQHLLDVTPALD